LSAAGPAKTETVYSLYVTEAPAILTGILSLGSGTAEPDDRIGDVMTGSFNVTTTNRPGR